MPRLRTPYKRALLLFLISACGDDGGDATATERDASPTAADAGSAADGGRTDAGPMIDAGGALLDASAAPAEPAEAAVMRPDGALADASDELLRALDRSGTRSDLRRAELVFEALCRHDVACGLIDDLEACLDEQVANAGVVLFGSEVCIDATLDQQACYATIGCEESDPCSDGLVLAFRACATFTELPP